MKLVHCGLAKTGKLVVEAAAMRQLGLTDKQGSTGGLRFWLQLIDYDLR